MKKSNILLLFILLLAGFLRFYHIDSNPPGLYIDETSIGYNAYSILETGKDEYGESFPLFFRSFGDYKPPVYIYMTAAAMSVFGKSEFAVRFVSAFFGTATILVFYFFVVEVFQKVKGKLLNGDINPKVIALLSTFLLAVTPWHIHFSRGGFEVTVALFFYLLGCLLTLIFWRKRKFRYLLLAGICFGFSVYTYHTYKIISPITWIIICGLLFFKKHVDKKPIGLALVIFIIVCIPMILFSFTKNGSERFTETSTFTEYPTKSFAGLLATYPMVELKNYFSFYSFDFLFSHGDGNGRHQLPGMGLLFKWELPFFLLGLFWIFRQKRKSITFVVLGLLFLAPLVPSVARPSPNTLRALIMVIPITIIVSCGLIYSFKLIKRFRFIYSTLFILIVSYSFALYMHGYYMHYPSVNALDWGAGYKEAVQKTAQHQKGYTYIIIDKNLTFAESYVHFYEPSLKVFYKPADWREMKELKGKVLFISIYSGMRDDAKLIEQVYLPGPNKTVYAQLWEL